MDYEKKYNEALERARKAYNAIKPENYGVRKIIENAFPELAESEDERNERIRKAIVHLLEVASEAYLIDATGFKKEQFLSYLEKKKESLHIEKMCKENVNSFTDGIIEVRSFQRGMEEGRRLEKQKEQEPRKFKSGEKVHRYDDDTNVITITGFRDDAYLTDSAYGPILFCDEDNWERIEKKFAEWSEEDQNNVNVLLSIIGEVREMRMQNTLVGPVETIERKRRFDKLEAWLKSLRPQPHWKPSEEQMDALEECGECKRCVKELYEQLKKLGVKEEPKYHQHFDPDC